ncbi:XRE family transcriptional regulator [Streptomyces sp. 8K308]|uniref:helix-turn-helix transcriptional regulator n=1 Tax=Streptomyces sp. 8K308 TaxID=2530388 RepID=UPI00104FB0C3|nr:helix-turn-helix transcriptional regulator [Streptomyces sp. 8K308]TDC27568.1 XRE family transcriptional regulator [Streptomyces sp. 8K308]
MSDNALGDFLRARRARLGPEDLGLASYGRRRVPGLRREEVAVLAGVNGDYYARLEQGRERHPSPQVLNALGDALRLDGESRDHLFRLAGAARDARGSAAVRRVSPELRALLDGYAHTPALVLDAALDVLAANALAAALFSPFRRLDNLALMAFLDPVARSFYRHWPEVAETTVASLRHGTGPDPEHSRLREVVDALLAAGDEFATLWHAHAVRLKGQGPKELDHPEVGALSLTYQTFDVRAAPGQQLVVYHAAPHTPSAQALSLLGSLHAPPFTC